MLSSIPGRGGLNVDDFMTEPSILPYFRFPSFPDVNTLKQRAALYFVNTDPLLEFERSLPPHVIPVGGIQMEHPKPLFAVSTNDCHSIIRYFLFLLHLHISLSRVC